MWFRLQCHDDDENPLNAHSHDVKKNCDAVQKGSFAMLQQHYRCAEVAPHCQCYRLALIFCLDGYEGPSVYHGH